MKLWSRIKSTLRNLFRKPQIESHLDQELRAYVDMVTDEKISAGISAPEARRIALAELGGMEQVKQAVREHRAGTGHRTPVAGCALRSTPTASQSRIHRSPRSSPWA